MAKKKHKVRLSTKESEPGIYVEKWTGGKPVKRKGMYHLYYVPEKLVPEKLDRNSRVTILLATPNGTRRLEIRLLDDGDGIEVLGGNNSTTISVHPVSFNQVSIRAK